MRKQSFCNMYFFYKGTLNHKMLTLLPKIIQIGLMIKLVMPNMVATNLTIYDNVNLNSLKFKYNVKISSSVTIATFLFLRSHRWPVATILKRIDYSTFSSSQKVYEPDWVKRLHSMHYVHLYIHWWPSTSSNYCLLMLHFLLVRAIPHPFYLSLPLPRLEMLNRLGRLAIQGQPMRGKQTLLGNL